MIRVTKIFIIWSLFILSATVLAQEDDYLDYITVHSEGRITRFTEMPILVYVEPPPESPELDGSFLDDLKYALHEWEISSAGNIKFELTEDRTNVTIGVIWARRSLMDMIDEELGAASIIRESETTFRVEITLLTRSKSSNHLLTHEQMRTVCLHEFGHAIGLWGHSQNTEDVMFFASEAQHPTARDMNTLMKVYELEQGSPQHEQAISVLKSKIEKSPKSARLQYLLGSVYLDKGDYDLAIDTFIYCLELDLFNKEAGKKLVQAYLHSGRKEDALKRYDKLLEINPSAEDYNMASKLAYELGQLEQAIRYIETALQINPRYLNAKNNLYNLYREQGLKALENQNYDAAISFYNQAIKLVSNDSIIYVLLGEAYSRKNDYKSAIEHYKKALQFNLGNTEVTNNLARSYNNLGTQLQNDGRWRDAIENYKEACKLMPEENQFKKNLENAYAGLGAWLFNAKDYNGAIEQWHQLLTYNHNQKEIYNNIGGAYFQLGNYPRAIESFKMALEINHENAEAISNLIATYQQYAQMLNQQGHYQDAVVKLQDALEIEPDNINLHLNLGYIHKRNGQYESAVSEYEKALAIKPTNEQAKKRLVNLHIDQGNKYMQARKYSGAIKEFEKIPTESRSVDIYNIMGYLYMETNQFPNAIVQFDKVLSQKPGDKTAYQNLRWMESTLKEKLGINDSSEVRDNLALAKCSLAAGLLNRKKETSAKTKLRQALNLNSSEPAVEQALVSTCLKLAKAFQNKGWTKNAQETAQWVLELYPENKQAKQILEQD